MDCPNCDKPMDVTNDVYIGSEYIEFEWYCRGCGLDMRIGSDQHYHWWIPLDGQYCVAFQWTTEEKISWTVREFGSRTDELALSGLAETTREGFQAAQEAWTNRG